MDMRLTLLLSFACSRDAQLQADRMCNCPHVEALGHAAAATLRLTFVVPETKLGWALALAEEPGLIGATSAQVEVSPVEAACVDTSTPPAQAAPPCGTDCSRCPHYLARCGGCPVTPFFRPGYRFDREAT